MQPQREVRVTPDGEDELARLVVEGVEAHVELARRGVPAARRPLYHAVVVHVHQELVVRVVVEHFVDAATSRSVST